MQVRVFETKDEMAQAAAEKAADILRSALDAKPTARFVAATGASQFNFLDYLTRMENVEWDRMVMFHLDEYVGLSEEHPASFRKYLRERLVEKVSPGEVHLIKGDRPDADEECRRLGKLISQAPVDVAFVGVGENGHLAFNDPPANFETEVAFMVVDLDDACRRQQVGEGWFETVEEVPRQAITMSIRQIMKAENIICTVPDRRKAEAVRDCLSASAAASPMHPASILKEHERAFVFLDKEAALLLEQ